MHADAATDFRLYHSNALDVLAALLADELRRPVPGQGLLEPDVVLIPQVALRRWLQATLAQAHGVSANLEFLTPGEFVQRALDANVPGKGEDLDAAALRWRIHAALADPALLRERALQPLRAYLEGAPDPLKAWTLSGELAQAFEKYKAWRREWLLAWEAGEAPRDPQAALWRRVAGGTRHRARRIQDYLGGFAAPGASLPAGLPKRLFAFAILNVSPDVLRVIATQSRVGTLHLYVPSPSRDYWGDLQALRGAARNLPPSSPRRRGPMDVAFDPSTPLAPRAHGNNELDALQVPSSSPQPQQAPHGRAEHARSIDVQAAETTSMDPRLRGGDEPEVAWDDASGMSLADTDDDPALAGDNPLLQAWGAAGRDFMAVLGGYEVVHPDTEIRGDADPGEGGGALAGSLLRRLQSDLFHRRAAPPPEPTPEDPRTRLPALRLDDPSLQVHACHTRLRELQVLHDQLRALFEDPRFDPPLQPREVAVLAPDIDPYLPYLDAVFGGRGRGDAIPYAVADASPLAGEPLADVFLRLLALPVARFGLVETLDLLASPPLAEAAQLDAAAFDRLHAWLHAAGARWGLDVAHRARLEAPADDAYTWAFALDRLLLGHATGSDAAIAGADGQTVAPMPELEGSALDALDTLVRLLRVLARHARALDEALTPEGWRERLLGLLEALLPRPPAAANTRRALDRLRTLIDSFASDASRAGVDTLVPAEIVRAHFAAALAEADTRAPLLTGGVSVARMVPMRLLPFRAICLLGMDDGAFPRRDPAGGIDRLASDVARGLRLRGDRSTRDDDRFLFLQLFAAAQDVFYVSYQGADPRDGSVREPSVLVADLLAAADAQHAPEANAVAALVVRHPLQPFAPAAFGDADEPRRFSFDAQWWPAAAQPSTRRRPLPPWFDGEPLPAPDDHEGAGSAPGAADAFAAAAAGRQGASAPAGNAVHPATLTLDELRRFLQAPAAEFLRQRLGLRLAEVEEVDEDVEPLLAPARGFARQALQQAVFDAVLRGDDDATTHTRLRARGLLPSGPLGRRTLEQVRAQVDPYALAFRDWRGAAQPAAPRLEVAVDGVALRGRIADAYPQGIARVRFDPPAGQSAIRNGLDWLLASAAGQSTPLVEFHDGGELGVGPHVRAPLDPAQARDVLRRLIGLRAQGLRRPLPFAPYSGWELFRAPTFERGLQLAAQRWHGSERSWGEGTGEALRLALRGRDPFGDEATQVAFVDLAMGIYSAVVSGAVYAGTDLAALRDIAAALDLEDAE
ncbi:exodeoxyribonuclease V subunit gamma [Luteimonas sp. M1R5S18]|uniref:RecBCD enzyme subunit RecC n=1 Tax=Luteimonas rhizosphaericola TaxID=3042024 RepID=A0ABT6JLB7_9GAMM|nr:exodeoxyribonuclease V subunit gamma [Luteimonas rhizosphaericola]MDH5830796.1 exodeoxyribonuclease V subunit gamma [Luteimonas rhizosphaericola]